MQSHPYRYLGGWLAFTAYGAIVGVIVVGLVYVWNFYNLFRYWDYLSSSFVWYDLFIVLLAIPCLYQYLKMSSEIRRRDYSFLSSFENGCILTLIYEVVIGFLGNWMIGYDVMSSGRISRIITTLIGFIIWELYFTKSIRVRTYFGTDKYLRLSKFFSRSPSPPSADPEEVNETPQNGWKCRCGRVNFSYVGTCACGRKREGFVKNQSSSNGWLCYCGKENPNYVGTCGCGRTRDWNEEFIKNQLAKRELEKQTKTTQAPNSVVKSNASETIKDPSLEDLQKLGEYKKLLDSGVIPQEMFDEKRKQILGN